MINGLRRSGIRISVPQLAWIINWRKVAKVEIVVMMYPMIFQSLLLIDFKLYFNTDDDDDVLPDVSVDGDTLSIPGNLSSLMGPIVTCEPEFVFKNSVT
ncbi:hypothetical protein B5X24_HaOG214231 [Helicoverpa armigera]|uniref:Uncharacterized protein n=1 Tax=Helicoverpa armigera TaxID=29058 RepID=A0A2W1BH89_HELAM|nr:hypothetical protein B5X24_HaOG214231 [Helicoverpa armigera]